MEYLPQILFLMVVGAGYFAYWQSESADPKNILLGRDMDRSDHKGGTVPKHDAGCIRAEENV